MTKALLLAAVVALATTAPLYAQQSTAPVAQAVTQDDDSDDLATLLTAENSAALATALALAIAAAMSGDSSSSTSTD